MCKFPPSGTIMGLPGPEHNSSQLKLDLDDKPHSLIITLSETFCIPIWNMTYLWPSSSVNNQQPCKIWNVPPRKPKEKVAVASIHKSILKIYDFCFKTMTFPPQIQLKEVTSDPNLSNQTPLKKPISILCHRILQRKSKNREEPEPKGLKRQK